MFAVNGQLAERLGINPTCELPSHAWPGGYPIYYLDDESGALCPTCANEYRHQVMAGDVNWEDGWLYCDQCSKRIESAYGDDEE